MTFLVDFSPIKPDFGLFFWTLLIFLMVWIPLGRYAFRTIGAALRTREQSIDDALKSAEKARQEISNMKSENEALLAQAREERTKMMNEAKEVRDQMINEAKTQARTESQRIVANAMTEIENQKHAAIEDLKNKAGQMAIEVAGKILRRNLAGAPEQDNFVKDLVKDIKLN